MVGYGTQNQYRIYDPASNALYFRRDIRFDEQVVGPHKPITTYDNFFHDRNTGDTAQIFLLLSGKTEQLTSFTPEDKNLTLYPTSSSAHGNFTLIQTSSQHDKGFSILVHVPKIAHDTIILKLSFPHLLKVFLLLKQHFPYLLPPIAIKFPGRLKTPATT